ncbi:hypothetical protein [Clostridium sp. 1xD42-85]|nr:hypothetical protein [Clostridium sp. 1xD42-85]
MTQRKGNNMKKEAIFVLYELGISWSALNVLLQGTINFHIEKGSGSILL